MAGHLQGGKHVPPNHAVFAGFHIRSGEIQLVESLKLIICPRAKIPTLVDERGFGSNPYPQYVKPGEDQT